MMAASRIRPIIAIGSFVRPPGRATTPRLAHKIVHTQRTPGRSFHTNAVRRQDVFHSQREDPTASNFLSSFQTAGSPQASPQTLTEKLFQKHALDLKAGQIVRSGDFITLCPHRCMTHDNSWPVALKFMEMGATTVYSKDQLVMTLDHDVQNRGESNMKKYRQIEEFARKQGVDFYPAGHGIGHQIMVEEGYAWPGTVAVASDSHTNMYGGVGCLGTPIVRTGAADVWATGSTWFKVPPVAKVTFSGELRSGVTGKDIIIALCGIFSNDEVLNHAIEFIGSEETMQTLPIDYRLAIANMTTEWGALSGLFPIDSLLSGWLRFKATMASMYHEGALEGLTYSSTITRLNHERIESLFNPNLNPPESMAADFNARYAKSLHLDLSTIPPYVSGPNSVKIANPVQQLEPQQIKVNKAYLVSCTNSRASDIASAAKVFREAAKNGQRSTIADEVKLYIAAASASEQAHAEAEGDWQILLQAGAEPLPSGCGPCIGLGTGLLEAGEVGISASNRNFKGRMGSRDAQAYLASPEVVAASALKGHISGPGWYQPPQGWSGVVAGEADGFERRVFGIEEALEKLVGQAESLVEQAERNLGEDGPLPTEPATTAAAVVEGFPVKISGEIVFCDADNINTDGIYPGKYTYQDNVTREVMSEVVMSNYDPTFPQVARENDILVSGFNFGCGSSREQAATAILAKGINLCVAGSFGNIFATNSINNALMGLEVPRLVERLREAFSSGVDTSSAPPADAAQEPTNNAQSLDSQPPAGQIEANQKQLTRRTGWTLEWDVVKSTLTIQEGQHGPQWTESVPAIPPNVQKIIAGGGLVKTRQAQFSQ